MKKHIELGLAGEYQYPPYQKFGPGMRSCNIIHYVISGKGYFTANGKTWTLEKGNAFIIYKGETVEYHADKDDPWRYVWIDFDGDMCEAMLGKTGFSIFERVTPPLSEEIMLPIFKNFSNEFGSESYELFGISNLFRLIAEIARVFPNGSGLKKNASIAEQAMDLINANYKNMDCRVEKIAEMLSVSRSQIYRSFVEKYGTSPKSYIDNLRIRYAKKLLCDEAITVAEVSYSSGFSDPLYFSGVFRRITGFSPSKYKKAFLTKKSYQECPKM